MRVIDGRTWLEILNPSLCWVLLAGTKVGRLGVLMDSAPEIYPVNYAVDRQTIVFRTDAGSKLRGLERSPAVCFEVDVLDPDQHLGWSVLVKGRARDILRADDVRRVEQLDIQPWALGRKAHWICIEPDEVTGRRIHTLTGPATP
jgi:hypothetical protein